MFYPPITLQKDGAVMLCEDASEFDANYDMPTPPPAVIEVEIKKVEEVDPVEKFAMKMAVLYDQVVEPMLNTNYSFESETEAIDLAQKLADDTTTIFNTMRIKLAKLAGIVCGGINERMATEAFQAHAGTFLKNANLVRQQGIETQLVTWRQLPTVSNGWPIERLIDTVSANPALLEQMLYEPELNTLLGSFDNPLRNFNGFIDLMQCLFRDKERLERLSTEATCTLSFNSLLADAPNVDDHDTNYQLKSNQKMLIEYLKLLSMTLREVCQRCYDLQVNLVDNRTSAEQFESVMRPLITKVINLFGIGVVIGCYYATCLRRAIAIQKGCESYTKLLLSTIENHNGSASNG